MGKAMVVGITVNNLTNGDSPMDYKSVIEKLNGRESKKVMHNTYLQWRTEESSTGERGRAVALKYHNTDVITWHADGRIVVDVDGWQTPTTKLRLNEFLPAGFRAYSDRGVWYISTPEFDEPRTRTFSCYECRKGWNAVIELSKLTTNLSGEKTEYCPKCGKKADYASPWRSKTVAYKDGLTLVKNGDGQWHVDPETVGEDTKAQLKLKRRVDKYAKGFVDALRAGKVEAPGLGDCMFCLMRDADKVPVGEAFKDKGHIESHIEEPYYVPSLVVRALEVFPTSQVMRWALAEVWSAEQSDGEKVMNKIDSGWASNNFVWDGIRKNIKRYVLRQLGMAS